MVMRNMLFLSGIAGLCILASCKPSVPDNNLRSNDTRFYPPRSFPSKEAAVALVKRAYGSFDEFEVSGTNVLVLHRHGFGVDWSDAAIYFQAYPDWRLIAYYGPFLHDFIDASIQGNSVILRSHYKKQVLLEVSIPPDERPNTALQPTATAPSVLTNR
jgi:hypothetical protein